MIHSRLNSNTQQRTTRFACTLSLVLLAALVSFNNVCDASNTNNNTINLRGSDDNKKNNHNKNGDPAAVVIYTFFSPIDNFSVGTYDHDMIEVWKSSWKEMGWEPRILTLEDAKKHPLYESYNKDLITNVQLNYLENNNVIRNNTPTAEYNRLCYLRWLAMAAVGGGWMADFDTVPLSPPNKPGDESPTQFTLHENHVPSLVSGSGEEWERMAMALLEEGKAHSPEFTSDMSSLMYLVRRDESHFNCDVRLEVIAADKVLHVTTILRDGNNSIDKDSKNLTTTTTSSLSLTQEDCKTMKDFRAVHFAHSAVKAARHNNPDLFPYEIIERPKLMKDWVALYKKNCHSSSVEM